MRIRRDYVIGAALGALAGAGLIFGALWLESELSWRGWQRENPPVPDEPEEPQNTVTPVVSIPPEVVCSTTAAHDSHYWRQVTGRTRELGYWKFSMDLRYCPGRADLSWLLSAYPEPVLPDFGKYHVVGDEEGEPIVYNGGPGAALFLKQHPEECDERGLHDEHFWEGQSPVRDIDGATLHYVRERHYCYGRRFKN